MAGYEVKLERFEGPLDLLLHLIQRDEIDIYDIPIARITQQYLTYIELMRLLDLDVAGEFLVMAATLMRIKAKMLLPTPPPGEEEEIDPRDELVQRLLEYRQFKEASSTLKTREEHRRLEYERGMVPGDEEAGPLPLAPATLFHLLDALNRVLARLPARTVMELEGEAYDIEEKIERIHNRVRVAGKLSFETLLGECRSRLEMIVTFLALLELLKMNRLSAIQDGNFGEIVLAPPVVGDVPSEWEGEPHGN
jgi:segregation and condensation protein A